MIRPAELVEIDRIAALEAELGRLRAQAYHRAGVLAPPRHERIANMIAVTATLFRTSTQMIVGPIRTRNVCRARNTVAWAAVQAFGVSTVLLGRELGGRDHSTIIHAIRRADELRRQDDRYRRITDLLLERFTPQSSIREEAENVPRSH